MTHTYKISGMTCEGCSAKVSYLLKQVPQITDVTIDLEGGKAAVTMNEHVPTAVLQSALKDYSKYQLTEDEHPEQTINVFGQQATEPQSWIQTYKPILLIFGYISSISLIAAYHQNHVNLMEFMRVFMSGFFLTFSFFKLLDLRGFASSYSMYDVVAKKWNAWGYIYVFIELALGLAFAINFEPVLTNVVTAIVMFLSLIGVLQSVVNKRKIRCACLGAVFNLPMSTVTIIEDSLMIAMSIVMLFMYL
jgi:copper chaperone CopZ